MVDDGKTVEVPMSGRLWMLLAGAVSITALVVLATLSAPLTPHRIEGLLIPIGGEDVPIKFADVEKYGPDVGDPENMSLPVQWERVRLVYYWIWYLAAGLLVPQVIGWLRRKNWVRIFSVIALAFLVVVLFIFVPECRFVQAPIILGIYIAYVAIVLSRKTDEAFRARDVVGFAFILPNFVGFLLWTSLPVIASFVLAFYQWDLIGAPKFVGLDNFTRIFMGAKTLFISDEERVLTDQDYDIEDMETPIGQPEGDGKAPDAGSGALQKVTLADGTVIAGVKKIIIGDRLFWKYFGNTLFYMLSIPVGMLGSLFLATVLNQKLKGVTVFRTVFYLPTVAAGIGMFILWKYIYNPDFGLLNQMLAAIGIKGPRWLADENWVKPAIMFMGFWGGVGGGGMILYLAALQNVDAGLYEAANIDGASAFQKFVHITIPMVSPTSFYIFIMAIIAGFQGGFQALYIMTKGGPAGASASIGYYIYQQAFEWFHMGYAAALSWFLFLVILVITLINWRWGGRTIIYD